MSKNAIFQYMITSDVVDQRGDIKGRNRSELYQECASISRKSFEAYADLICADHHYSDKRVFTEGHGCSTSLLYECLRVIYDPMFDKYDNVLFVDTDIVVKYGRTEDLERRTSEHNNDYSKLENVELRLMMYSFVDSSYAVHDNMRSHTGGLVSFGIGAAHTRSTTSKINVKSATESELVSASEYLPYTLWFKHFMEEQGYKIKDNVLYQDNKSAILMEINGRNSCTGNSRHINIRYFWMKDRIDNKEVRVEYLPTHIMLADYFTKPLQGSQFRLLREFIMGWRPLSDIVLLKENESK